jgi:hypothetical protein
MPCGGSTLRTFSEGRERTDAFYLHGTPKALGHYRQYVALGGNDARVRQLLKAAKRE